MRCSISQPPLQSTTISTFVVRFCRETTAGEARWRGRIEHVQSGAGLDFLELDEMVQFMQRFGTFTRPESASEPSSPLRRETQNLEEA